jgi:hypothetical protein
MKNSKPNTVSWLGGLFAAGLLAVILAILFCKSFLPGFVHFSNDGPLGQQNAAWRQVWPGLTGAWYDLNDIGNNAGSFPLSVSTMIFWALRPVGFAKFYAPIGLFLLGLGAWTFFRQLRLSPLAAALGALAALLNSTFFGNACWGVASHQIAIGMDFFALALVVANTAETPRLIRGTRLALAGLAVGMNVMEAADIGAMLSVFVAAFILVKALADEGGPVWVKWGRGIGRVLVVAVFAGFISLQTLVALVGIGITGTVQSTETREQRRNFATQWSFPKVETLGLFVPGLFGYRLDTPHGMMTTFAESYQGGNYWGAVGRDPLLDPYFSGEKKGPVPPGQLRQTSGTNYVGIFVTVVAFWAVAQSLRRRDSLFPQNQRRLIWFLAVVLLGSLLLAYGRFAPFYKLVYLLPYSSTMRNPTKFLIVFSFAVVVLFAYGIHALSRRYLETPASGAFSFKNWWTKACAFDRKWTAGCGVALAMSVCACLIYATQKPGLVRYLQTAGFGEDMAGEIAAFSIGQAGWFLLLFALALGLFLLVIAGVFAGKGARLGGVLLGVLLVADLGRADLPYIIHWDYIQKYDIDTDKPGNSTNPIINFLRVKPYEHRVIGLLFDVPEPAPYFDRFFGGHQGIYAIEWAQHHFPYYNIQSLDKIQMPRPPADLVAYEMMLTPRSGDTAYLLARRWELTNTRYLLGPTAYWDALNGQLDPALHRIRIVQRFDIVPKPGLEQVTGLDQLTAATSNDGACALFEFTGALPRAKLYSRWQTNSPAAWHGFTTNGLSEVELYALKSVGTNDFLTLKQLASLSFDPRQVVLLANPLPVPAANATNENAGTVEFKSYAPTDMVLGAQVAAPSVLLLNDMFDPHWRVLVDGKPAELLRCNFIMRGVYLTPGPHTVEFQFHLPHGLLYVSLAASVVLILLCGILFFSKPRNVPQPRDHRQP